MESHTMNNKQIKKEIKDIEEYISKLKNFGIYTEYQKEDLKYNEAKLEELNTLSDEKNSII